MNIEVAFGIFKGLALGIRHFDPVEYAPYYEVQIYLLMFRIDIFFLPTSEE